jgi:hypothetical protein
MFLALILSTAAWAVEPLPRPEPPKKVDGECRKTYPIRAGQSFHPSLLSSSPAIASCSGLVVPLSDYADLLLTEQWAKSLESQFRVEVGALQMERDWYKNKLEEVSQPAPWLERSTTQRWLGRIETIAIVGIVTAGLGTTYYYSSGGQR